MEDSGPSETEAAKQQPDSKQNRTRRRAVFPSGQEAVPVDPPESDSNDDYDTLQAVPDPPTRLQENGGMDSDSEADSEGQAVVTGDVICVLFVCLLVLPATPRYCNLGHRHCLCNSPEWFLYDCHCFVAWYSILRHFSQIMRRFCEYSKLDWALGTKFTHGKAQSQKLWRFLSVSSYSIDGFVIWLLCGAGLGGAARWKSRMQKNLGTLFRRRTKDLEQEVYQQDSSEEVCPSTDSLISDLYFLI